MKITQSLDMLFGCTVNFVNSHLIPDFSPSLGLSLPTAKHLVCSVKGRELGRSVEFIMLWRRHPNTNFGLYLVIYFIMCACFGA